MFPEDKTQNSHPTLGQNPTVIPDFVFSRFFYGGEKKKEEKEEKKICH